MIYNLVTYYSAFNTTHFQLNVLTLEVGSSRNVVLTPLSKFVQYGFVHPMVNRLYKRGMDVIFFLDIAKDLG
jgi:hypothetical protein